MPIDRSAIPKSPLADGTGCARTVAGWIDQCINHGVDHFFVAPGSRCTPITLAIAQNPRVTSIRHFDERGLAFACLGYGRSTRRAAAFVCTSGTAVANAMPAVIEASLERVPMLVLTADRPPELRDTSANQTVDQVKLFGSYPTWQFDLPCPTQALAPNFWESTFSHAIRCSVDGPVHLNCMFREPFDLCDPFVPNNSELPLGTNPVATPSGLGEPKRQWTPPRGKTIVTCGNCQPAAVAAASRLAERLDAPFLNDIVNGPRRTYFDLALLGAERSGNKVDVPRQQPKRVPSHDNVFEQLGPEVVIHVGGRMVSKRIMSFLNERCPKDYLLLTERSDRCDPLHQVTQVLRGELATLCDSADLPADSSPGRSYRELWQRTSDVARRAANDVLQRQVKVTEPNVAHSTSRLIPDHSAILLGNSMPIRDFESFAEFAPGAKIQVIANRGASGIDGLIATACGVAIGTKLCTTAVVGDLSALHDLNSLSLLTNLPARFVLIVINNDGGGIFHFLPVADKSPYFESYFGTPHGRNFRSAATMFDLNYSAPATVDEFESNYLTALTNPAGERATLIEVRTNRQENFRLHHEIQTAVHQAIGGLS